MSKSGSEPRQRFDRELSAKEKAQRMAGGVYNDIEIRQGIEEGWIILDPNTPVLINNSSIDVTLGEHFYATDGGPDHGILNMFDPTGAHDYFRYFHAETHEHMLHRLDVRTPLYGIPLDARVVILEPNERVLGHTAEAVGVLSGGTTQMQAKSTIGRWGAGVCLDAGWGDEGYVSPWTMEIINVNRRRRIVLVVGMRISQIVCYKMNPADRSYGAGGHYQSSIDPAKARSNWHYTMMLPRVLNQDDIIVRDQ